MRTTVLSEYGFQQAMMGLSLSYNVTSKIEAEKLVLHMARIAEGLAHKGGGHNKFLESITVYVDMCAPRYFWQQFDTYRVGVSKQSQSTMHTITNRKLTQGDFEFSIPQSYLDHLNNLITCGKIEQLKNDLPEGFLQTRIVCTNYKALQNIFKQRENHKLREWRMFCAELLRGIKYPQFIKENR